MGDKKEGKSCDMVELIRGDLHVCLKVLQRHGQHAQERSVRLLCALLPSGSPAQAQQHKAEPSSTLGMV